MSTSLRDTLVRERYLLRFSWALQDFPGYRTVVRDLRTELTATAAETGMRRAVADLGHPRVLADGYLAELDRPVPRWTTGAVWGALALGALLYLAMAYGFGTLDTLEELGGGTVQRAFLGVTTTFTNDGSSISMGSTVTWQALAVYAAVFAVPFLLGARVWRAWRTTPATRA
ncbi:hypothetical protein [Cellulomonas fengjieae]|uniref:Uncharacterized protein n=1 Tax=Cellulomonas fengjieae TaxID=2819978 RepID=A0ABS3SCX3_9CELL|nr:hypothetical protein [Cellulomonas fengjieae]MBO3083607.1 hypothetical protein [Cellulomonas fengjieae]QVI65076.1 hypothetical protein KG102_13160 [Cellulomonas fengjieae]